MTKKQIEEALDKIYTQTHLLLYFCEDLHKNAKNFSSLKDFELSPCCLDSALLINVTSAMLIAIKSNKHKELALIIEKFLLDNKNNCNTHLVGDPTILKDDWDSFIFEK